MQATFIEEIYHTHVDLVYRFIYHKVLDKETAEDLTSAVFLKALRSNYQAGRAKVSTWLLTIARNTVIDHYRTKKPGTASITDIWDLSDNTDLPAALDQVFTNTKLKEAMQRLSPEEREILTLRFWQEYSFTEIAELLHKKPGTVKMKSLRAIQKLRSEFPLFLLFTLSL